MTQPRRLKPGAPFPLGATWQGRGTNFALYSESASAVDLCLFDMDGVETRIPVRQRTDFVWHVHVEAVGPGQAYGYRVDGPWEPQAGLRFDARRVLLDPYAKALAGMLGVVVDPSFDWGDDAPPNVPMHESLIYEAHVKGMTARHPRVPPELRGTYLGLVTDPIVQHLRELGVTAVELLPVQGFVDPPELLARGLRNYWGYDPIAFFAPDPRYRAGATAAAEVTQWKRMVKALHAAGVEVILDVGYNHTAEGDERGPTLSFRGIDNATYYRLARGDASRYVDSTGMGNALNVQHPQVLRLIMDSLRYWVEEMHVDGFRFDLAATMARSLHEADRLSSFFSVIHQDPVLGRVKLIAEPWDLGDRGSTVGRFPVRWSEWNFRYRDTVRAFWRGDPGRAADLTVRLTGSPDLYERDGRRTHASVNFVSAHDGMTLRDVVSYARRHNEANGEDDRDGGSEISWNEGVEGETDDPRVLGRRARDVRNLLATLLLSQGTPMLCAGDEIGRTQRGNDNAYCQDNEIGWLDWALDDRRAALLDFVRRLARLRRAHPLLRRPTFFRGREIPGLGVRDLAWIRPDGAPLTDAERDDPATRSLGMFAAGSALGAAEAPDGGRADDDLLLLLNGGDADVDFLVPALADRGRTVLWELALDTANEREAGRRDLLAPGTATRVAARSLQLFTRRAVGSGGLRAVQGAPISSYRLQLQPAFGFRDARDALDYLDDLGVGGLYLSPCFRPEHGSTHGYDVVDHGTLNPELGSDADFRALAEAARARRLPVVIDFVPNHVGVGSATNAWWRDVLENGPTSPYAGWFDIAWDAPDRRGDVGPGKVLLPILGRQFGEEVDDGKITVVRDGGSLFVEYGGRRLPASPRSYAQVIERALVSFDGAADDRAPERELESILGAVRHLPPIDSTEPGDRAAGLREKDVVQRRLAALAARSPAAARALDQAARAIAASPERLEAFLAEQHYRLSYWRVAAEEINYRRFFDVNELAAVRMEEPEVFASAHRRLFELIAEGSASAVRLDHTDGLYDPLSYFQALQEGARDALQRGGATDERPIYVVAEKILERGETLPRTWPISGTSGYDFLAVANGLFVDPAGEVPLTRAYVELTGGDADFRAVVDQAKRDVLAGSFAGEVRALADALKAIAERDRHARDFTRANLTRVIRETIAAFPVYRTYVRPDGSREKDDEARIGEAVARARRRSPTIEGSTFDFLQRVLLLRAPSEEATRFAMRFQQLTGPVMAKGVEDTALYRYARLVGLNDVGCDPGRFGTRAEAFHAHNARILAEWPLSMTTVTTHDTKWSADVRARLAVLSEIPDAWADFARELRARSAGFLRAVDGEAAPSPTDTYLFAQAAVGAYPFEGIAGEEALARFSDRLAAYLSKAVHEAKVRTSWTNPDARYDRAVDAYVRGVLAAPDLREAIAAFAARVAAPGASNSLALLALQLASPGVADVYQGSELWTLSLVDPDNRLPVAFAERRPVLNALREAGAPDRALAEDLVRRFADGRIKLHVTRTALRLRREMPALFLEGTYRPLEAPEDVIAFERTLRDRRLVCVVPRFTARRTGGKSAWALGDVWGDLRLPLAGPGRFRNVFTGERLEGGELRLADVFGAFPVAWLVRE